MHSLPTPALDGLPDFEGKFAHRRQRAFRRRVGAISHIVDRPCACLEVGQWLSMDDLLRQIERDTSIERFATSELDQRWKSGHEQARLAKVLDSADQAFRRCMGAKTFGEPSVARAQPKTE
jgi:hypothetical protein